MIPDPHGVPSFARYHFSRACAAALVLLASVFLLFKTHANLGGSSLPSQDPDSKPAPAPAAQQPATATSKLPTETPKDSAPLKKAVHDKKVITEEDLAKPEKPLKFSDADEEENSAICDLSCEAELKSRMGITHDRELEFRNQLTLARNEIANDHAWNSMLDGALHAASSYCDLQRQKAEILSKGDASDLARSMVNSRYANRERDLSLQYRNSAGQVTQRISAVQRFAPLRASVMQYQWDDSINRACPDFRLP